MIKVVYSDAKGIAFLPLDNVISITQNAEGGLTLKMSNPGKKHSFKKIDSFEIVQPGKEYP